ncbi:sensor histidine kinase [Rhodopseudomonas palustris]|uniref:sensor histidine kinase n=1 Tax=Rhodopseudomonas palustris TaxID=1076 RepID=UPI000E5B2A1F|nr:ATP-binding protein [Rhodopseudomonas palustris]QLH71135.1 two-component sensor histidine kinase [Rhodopseudomonas palustris]RIA02828.1 two-component sensor histidine kinase [Rhodopseudomonas palustris]
MFRRDSLAARILLLHVVALTITAVVLPLILFCLLNREIDRLHGDAMRRQAEVVAEHLSVGPDGQLSLTLPQDLRDVYSAAYGRYAYAVVDSSGKVLFSSNPDRKPLLPPRRSADRASWFGVVTGSSGLSGDSIERRIGDRTLTIQVVEDLSNGDVIIDDIAANFFHRAGWIVLPILLLLLAFDIVIFRRAIRPLVDASERAAGITPSRTDIRLPMQGIPSEIRPLVSAVNQAFDRLEHGFNEQRRFTADAAHELRTPLAILSARIETLQPKPSGTDLQRNLAAMSRIVSQLLDVAEMDVMRVDPDEAVDLVEIATELIETVAPAALAAGKEIGLRGGDHPVPVRGNAEMIRRALRNLVDNAIRHTPPGTEVMIEVDAAGPSVAVRDHGPGIAEADRGMIFQRFWRGDRARSDGAGLGLAIVKAVVDEHGGAIDVADAPGGGALITLTFQKPDVTSL